MTQVLPDSNNGNNILFPVGRLVSGDLYTPQDTDLQGNKLTIKSGPNAGKERVNYFFALAVQKSPGATHWAQEPGWGQKIWALGHAMWPQNPPANNTRFAWKIEDGDSTTPNENNRRNCDREGYPGHWILKFGSMFPAKVVDEQGQPLLTPGLVKRGFYIEVWGSIESNNNTQKPGIYLNHNFVAYRAPGKEIANGPDPRAVGFGRSALPAGVTAAPVGNVANFPAAPPAAAPAVPGAFPTPPAAMPTAPALPPGVVAPPAAAQAPGAYPAAPVAVAPHPGFIAPPAPGALPAVAPAPAAAPVPPAAPVAPVAGYTCPLGAPAGHRMVNGGGARYEQFRQQGWTDAQLLSSGHMVRL